MLDSCECHWSVKEASSSSDCISLCWRAAAISSVACSSDTINIMRLSRRWISCLSVSSSYHTQTNSWSESHNLLWMRSDQLEFSRTQNSNLFEDFFSFVCDSHRLNFQICFINLLWLKSFQNCFDWSLLVIELNDRTRVWGTWSGRYVSKIVNTLQGHNWLYCLLVHFKSSMVMTRVNATVAKTTWCGELELCSTLFNLWRRSATYQGTVDDMWCVTPIN